MHGLPTYPLINIQLPNNDGRFVPAFVVHISNGNRHLLELS